MITVKINDKLWRPVAYFFMPDKFQVIIIIIIIITIINIIIIIIIIISTFIFTFNVNPKLHTYNLGHI